MRDLSLSDRRSGGSVATMRQRLQIVTLLIADTSTQLILCDCSFVAASALSTYSLFSRCPH